MQRALFDSGWSGLWPLQDEAIDAILGGCDHVLLVGDTASGKTEGAFLPILSLPLPPEGFGVLYVSPLRALLNDQCERLRALGSYAGAEVHLWHGDVPRSRKRHSQAQPRGVLLTTPESLEAICLHRALLLPLFFRRLRFVVVDELHAFLGTGRGLQLASLLGRIERHAERPPRRVGLSATVGDKEAARAFLGAPCAVCSGAGPRRASRLAIRHDPEADPGRQVAALTRGRKALIFCNARARVEQLTYDLNRLAGDPDAYLPHHGSLHARERARAESGLRAARAASIVCTSTLELGIDVGAVDLVVQVDCTQSVASLRQRLGRSGRLPGQPRSGVLLTSDDVQLAHAVAVVELLRHGWVEPPPTPGPGWDVLWQQTLSTAIERGGLTAPEAAALPPALLEHWLAHDHLAWSGDRLIAGLEGERLARRRDFYAVFAGDDAFEVAAGPRILGRLAPLPAYQPGTPLIFAGRVWTVSEVDWQRRRIELTAGAAGRPPLFSSQPGRVHDRVRGQIVALLLADTPYPYLDARGQAALDGLRREFRALGLSAERRPCVVVPGLTELHAFAGDRVAYTLALLAQLESGFAWETTPWGGVAAPVAWPWLAQVLTDYALDPPPARELLAALMRLVPDEALRLPKFACHLPREQQREIHAATEIDLPGALDLVRTGIRATELEPCDGN